jgi:hypothetical protein
VAGTQGAEVNEEDEANQIAYRRRERAVALSDQDDATVLGDRARAELRDALPRPTSSLKLLPGADGASLDELSLGDIVEVSYRAGWVRLAGLHRITRLEVAIPDSGSADTITATVEPWGG